MQTASKKQLLLALKMQLFHNAGNNCKEERKMTKIAISSTGKTLESEIDERFGRCRYFLIIEIEKKKLKM